MLGSKLLKKYMKDQNCTIMKVECQDCIKKFTKKCKGSHLDYIFF